MSLSKSNWDQVIAEHEKKQPWLNVKPEFLWLSYSSVQQIGASLSTSKTTEISDLGKKVVAFIKKCYAEKPSWFKENDEKVLKYFKLIQKKTRSFAGRVLLKNATNDLAIASICEKLQTSCKFWEFKYIPAHPEFADDKKFTTFLTELKTLSVQFDNLYDELYPSEEQDEETVEQWGDIEDDVEEEVETEVEKKETKRPSIPSRPVEKGLAWSKVAKPILTVNVDEGEDLTETKKSKPAAKTATIPTKASTDSKVDKADKVDNVAKNITITYNGIPATLEEGGKRYFVIDASLAIFQINGNTLHYSNGSWSSPVAAPF
jgi:hypothetical protein